MLPTKRPQKIEFKIPKPAIPHLQPMLAEWMLVLQLLTLVRRVLVPLAPEGNELLRWVPRTPKLNYCFHASNPKPSPFCIYTEHIKGSPMRNVHFSVCIYIYREREIYIYIIRTGKIEDKKQYFQIEGSHFGEVGPWFQIEETDNVQRISADRFLRFRALQIEDTAQQRGLN